MMRTYEIIRIVLGWIPGNAPYVALSIDYILDDVGRILLGT